MLVRVITTFKDKEHDYAIREKGSLLKVSPSRGADLIKKGLAVEQPVIDLVPKAKPKAKKKAKK